MAKPQPFRPEPRTWLVNLLIVAVSIATGCALLEGGIRLFDLDPASHEIWRQVEGSRFVRSDRMSGLRVLRPNSEWAHRYSSNERLYFDEGNKIVYRANSAGFRDEEFSRERKPDTLRIGLLGDSFGFGTGVKDEDMVTTLLEPLLSEQVGCSVEVYNFAIPGYSAADEVLLLEHIIRDYTPDTIIIWYFLNDVEAPGTLSFLGGGDEARRWFLPRAQELSALARFVGVRVDSYVNTLQLVRIYQEAYADERWTATATAFRRMANLTRQADIPIVMFVHPLLYQLDGHYPFLEIHQQVVRAAEESGIIAFDLFDIFEGKVAEDLWVHPSDQHPNETAHAMAADYVASRMSGLLPACDS